MTVTTHHKTENGKATGPDQSVMDQWLNMFALLVHDLESPLATMKYLLRLLEKGQLDQANPRHRQIIDSSRIAVERAESILYDTMAVARAGTLGLSATLEKVEIDAVLHDVVSMATPAATERNVELITTKLSSALAVNADTNLLKRALDNLLYNAIRHTPEGGTVAVYTSTDSGWIEIHVKDSGDGFGDANPNELFERYGQIKKRVQGSHRGVGLGLYFSTLAITAMNGTISAANHPDGGAVFTIRLSLVTGGNR